MNRRRLRGMAQQSRRLGISGPARGMMSPISGPSEDIPPLAYGVGDSIIGGSTNYFPFYNWAAGTLNGRVRYMNRGRPGQYSQIVYNNFNADAIANSPDWVVCCTGTNDRGGGVQTIQAGTGNCGNAVYYVRLMIDATLAVGKKFIFCSINHRGDLTSITSTNFINDTIKADILSGAYASAHASGQVFFCDTQSVISDHDTAVLIDATYMQGDFVHPTHLGGRIMGAKLAADWLTFGLRDYDYPWTHFNSGTAIVSNGTFTGTVQGNGAAATWNKLTGDGLTTLSVVAAPAGYPGNAQELSIGAGSTAAAGAGVTKGGSITNNTGRKVGAMAHTIGSGFADQGATTQVKFDFSGTVFSPSNAVSTLGAGQFDSTTPFFHYGEAVITGNPNNLNVYVTTSTNPGASAVTIDLFDVMTRFMS